MHLVSAIIIAAGMFFFMTATIGLLRFPDFYTRMHATGKGDTLGVLLILLGLALHAGPTLGSLKIILIAVFIFLTSPTATHSIARAALKRNVPIWTRKEAS